MRLIPSEAVKMRPWCVAPAAAAATAVALRLVGCHSRLQRGRSWRRLGVKDITLQDVRAELDRTPDEPSDLARLQQIWLADKAAKRLLVGLTAPTDA